MPNQKASRPIIFNSENVRAILDGRKVQTRRVVTRMNSNVDGHGRANKEFWGQLDFSDYYLDSGPSPAGNPGPYLKIYNPIFTTRHRIYPIWFPGDKLWVRETWGEFGLGSSPQDITGNKWITYKADASDWKLKTFEQNNVKWKSPIYMPKKHSRITLEIKDVRVERVQDISNEDIVAEGISIYITPSGSPRYKLAAKPLPLTDYVDNPEPDKWIASEYLRAYWGHYWDSVNYKRGFGYHINPHVWVLELERSDNG